MISFEKIANPQLLWLLLVLVPLVAYYVYRNRQGGAAIQVSSTQGLEGLTRTAKYYLRHLPFVLRCAAIALLIVALARPQTSESNETSTAEGIDIMMALDISGSMLARDFRPDRITAAKEITQNFINDRPNDRIGLVVFAGEAFTQSPLTTDKATLITLLSRVREGMIDDGTAIGNGLATAVNRLRKSSAASKVIILLTDGVNNSGQVAPLTAAEIAQTFGIRVYTIGIGTTGMAPTPAIDGYGRITYIQAPVEIDEEILTQISQMTGGQYFRATDNDKLRTIYEEINQLEKTQIEVDSQTRWFERFMPFALAALALVVLELLLRYFYFRRIP
ncbi:MAG: VWA domain-containing protein [Rikenellaceae bacterium]|jgi:Ca-activated chloride channel family protein|nr:VWA domain-containing protein [Rikenellaceae bacterium]